MTTQASHISPLNRIYSHLLLFKVSKELMEDLCKVDIQTFNHSDQTMSFDWYSFICFYRFLSF